MSIIKTNIHSHTLFCDGTATPEEMIKAAINKCFVSFGFSAHSVLPYDNDYSLQNKVSESNYIKTINDLKQKYSNDIEVLLGLELDIDSDTPQYNYDFLISAVHQLHPNKKTFAVDSTIKEFEECLSNYSDIYSMAEDFYKTSVDAALRKNIDVVAHYDLISKFNENEKYFKFDDKRYLDIALDNMNDILNSNPEIFFEINTGAISRKYRTTPYPDCRILKHLSDKDAKIIINSDSHSVDSIDFGFDDAINHCINSEIKRVYILRKSGFEKVDID